MLGIGQTDLANAVGVTFQQIQKYEMGTNRVSASRLQQMTRVLKVPVSYFFEDPAERSAGPKGAAELEPLLATSGVSLVRAFTGSAKPKLRCAKPIHRRIPSCTNSRAGDYARELTGARNLNGKDSLERIDDRNALDLAAMAHVLGIEFSAAKRTSSGDDGRVPIGQPMRSLDCQCASHDRH